MLTQLHRAAYKGDLEAVSELLQTNNINVDSTTQNGETALHMASFKGHTEIVKTLIQHAANIHVQTNNQQTALHHACINNHLEIAQLLLEEGTDVNQQDNKGMTPLHHSSIKGSLEMVTLLLKHGTDVKVITNSGMTATHLASIRGHLDVLQVLVDKEWLSMLYGDQDGTPLHLAIQHGRQEAATFLTSRVTSKCQELLRLTRHSNNTADQMNQKFAELAKICLDLKKEMAKTRQQNKVQIQINSQIQNLSATTGTQNNNRGNISSSTSTVVEGGKVEHSRNATSNDKKDKKGQKAKSSFYTDQVNVLSLALIMCLSQIIISNIMKRKALLQTV